MKKLLINLFLAITVTSIISASPQSCAGKITCNINLVSETSAIVDIAEENTTTAYIHPLDILSLKFN